MTVLLINFLFCAFYACFLYMGTSASVYLKNNRYFKLTFVLCVLIHGLVEPNSLPDIGTYENVFDRLYSMPITAVFTDNYQSEYNENFDIGYKLVLSVIGKIWHNISFFLLINSFIFCYLYYSFFRRYSPLFALSVLLFLLIPYNQSLFVLRQHLSVAILLLSFPYIIERNLLKFSFVILISATIHFSSVVFFPVYFFYGIKNKRWLQFTFLASVIMCVAIRVIIPLIAFLMANNERYGGYVEDAEIGIASRGIIMIIILFFYCFILKDKIYENGINRLVLVISLWGTLIALSLGIAGAGRLFLSYYIILLIQIPIIICYIKKRIIRYWFTFSIILALTIFAYVLSVDVDVLMNMNYIFYF